MIPIIDNPTSVSYHYTQVKNIIQERIKNVLRLKYVLKSEVKTNTKNKTKRKTKYKVDPILQKFLVALQVDKNLEALITLKPDKFGKLIKIIKARYPSFVDKTTHSNRILYNIFISNCYNQNFNKWEFINRISIDTCPYCNRNYIYSLDSIDGIKPQIDHFFPKSIYPFLGMSYYNLIPCCQTCNGFGGKEEKDPLDFDLKNPYEVKLEDFIFSYEIDTIETLNPLINKNNISHDNLKITFKAEILGYHGVFKLDKLYSKHIDHILELIIKSKLEYTKEYRKYLESYRDFNFSQNEIDRMIIGNYSTQADIHKRPLSKLYRDISIELGLVEGE